MELKTVNNTLKTLKKVYEKKSEYPIDCEFTLPDYCPDIERILKCNIFAKVSNLSVLSDTAQAEINVEIKVLYISKDNKLFGYEMPQSLSKSINIGEIDKETVSSYKIKTEYANCRAVNNRKIDVHGSVGLTLTLKVEDEKNYISDIDDKSVVLKNENRKVLEPVGFAKKQINVADDIILPSSNGSISNIINYDVKSVFEECKMISGKAIIKLNVLIEMLYLSSDLRYETIRHNIPVNQVIDVPGAEENSICSVKTDVSNVTLKVITDSEGEMRAINAEVKVDISVVAYNLSDLNIVTDGYCVKYESNIERQTVNCEQFVENINENFNISESIDVSSDIASIIDFNCMPLTFNCKCENNNLVLSGDIAVFAFLEDENGSSKYYEKVLPFSKTISKISCAETMDCDLSLTVTDCSFNKNVSNRIDFKCEMNLNGIVTKPLEIEAISSFEVDEEKEKSYDDLPSLVAYFAQKGESIWDIALKYNTSLDRIKETNNINDEILNDSIMLLIPSI